MKLCTVWLLFLGLLSAPCAAQPFVIHEDPQKAIYADPSEFVDPDLQCHWRAPGIGFMPGMPAHTHAKLKCPDYAEIGGWPFTCDLTITLFNTTGQINAGNITGPANAKVVMDTAYPLVGDAGVKVFTGKVTYNLADSGLKVHGWQPIGLRTVTDYTNRDILVQGVDRPVYSVVDLTAPESPPGDGTGIRTRVSCQITDASDPEDLGHDRWQANRLEFLQILPVLGPVTPGTSWTLLPLAYNYAATTGLPPGTFEERLDADLHNGIPGTLLLSSTHGDQVSILDKFSVPDGVPDGPHTLLIRWNRQNMGGDKELDSLVKFNVTVGPGGVAQPPNTAQMNGVFGTAPSPPPPTGPVGLTLTVDGASAATVAAGQPYTLAAVVNTARCHSVTLDGVPWTSGTWTFSGSPLMGTNDVQARTTATSRTHTLSGSGLNCKPSQVSASVTVQ